MSHGSIRVSSPTLYLDEDLQIWGSGFEPAESVNVYLDVDGNTQPNLGFADATFAGAWTLEVGVLGEVRGVSSGNGLRLTNGEPFSLMAIGSNGTRASVPVFVQAKAPVQLDGLTAAPRAASLVAGTIESGKVLTVYGAGYLPNEVVSLEIAGLSFASAVAGELGALGEDLAVILEPGMYTLVGVGDQGSLATAPLIVVCGPTGKCS